jgi:hypothetical protein
MFFRSFAFGGCACLFGGGLSGVGGFGEWMRRDISARRFPLFTPPQSSFHTKFTHVMHVIRSFFYPVRSIQPSTNLQLRRRFVLFIGVFAGFH